MKRRTDRAIAISAVTAVAVVPTAVLMVVKVGGGSTEDGSVPASAAMAQQDPANPNGTATGIVTPGATTAPGAGGGGTGGTADGSGAPGNRAAGGSGLESLPTAPPRPGPSLHAFTRKTDVKVTLGSDGDYRHATETATFTLWPEFSLNATGVTSTMQDGELSKVTEKVIISGGTLKGFDGEKWTRSKLSAKQLATLQNGSDPRQFTFLIGTLPGVTASEPDANGRTRFTARASMGNLFPLLPQDVAAAIRTWIPAETGCGLDLWADSKARPTWIGLNAQAAGTVVKGSMTFDAYR
ncbi:hypothetical protein E1281_05590 [Actinomadura sp. KC345]|uniref:hypothetical protein n=1 Tax=Actinomadura sp. KC345 TaxID=2530371 RepID=UPI00104673F4|nr:hypothetical protein [Actinomadura sp. KC345]TDC57248.1 hypothetical protein E1281_05590 [Actinomadura sp. KC345]